MIELIDQIYDISFPVLKNCHIGELYLEKYNNLFVQMSQNKVSTIKSSRDQGFALRKVDRNFNINFISNVFSLDNLQDACSKNNCTTDSPRYKGFATRNLYPSTIEYATVDQLIDIMNQINHSIRSYEGDAQVENVVLMFLQETKDVAIIRNDNQVVIDNRPMVRLIATTYILNQGEREKIFISKSVRNNIDSLESFYKYLVNETHRRIKVFEKSIKVQSQTCPIVFGPGAPGILLHEAIGHGLEGDFNSKNISVFSGKIGEKISHSEVTIVDDGTIDYERGSIAFDDEGNPSQRNVLVENGILKRYLTDRITGEKLSMPSSSGRRQSYHHLPMPRMTNTFMLSGSSTPEKMLSSLDNGVYAVNFSNGSVDIVSGQFAFVSSEAYMVRNGKVCEPISGCTISGVGMDTLSKVVAVGNDSQLAIDGGTCGKNSQWVPVGVGQPHILVESMIISGQ